jgi:nucleoside-triphosphatase THEP1
MSIYIFCRPIHSGKTTELLHWCNQQKNVMGIAMPDINGSRKIIDLLTKEVFDIECSDTANTTEPLTSVGRFHFYTKAFEKANAIILLALSQNPYWLVIDEAGKLELDGKGFYNSLTAAAVYYNNKKNNGNLLITVRENLCTEVINFFTLRGYITIYQLDDLI